MVASTHLVGERSLANESPQWSGVSLWELPAYYRRLKGSVLALENAWEDDRLDAALADTDVLAPLSRPVMRTYERLQTATDLPKSAFRRDSIHAVLEPVKELLASPRLWFPVRKVLSEPVVDPLEPHARSRIGETLFEVSGPRGTVDLRLSQMVSARFWGLGFEFPDRRFEKLFVSTLVSNVLDRLAVDLSDLAKVQRWFRRQTAEGLKPIIVPDPQGRRFEQLMIDMLNESESVSRRARLSEDFLEKTDLRLRLPDLKRRRGARVQVTQTTHPDYLARKRSSIRLVNEYVILSPLPLAEAVADPASATLLTKEERTALWSAFQRRPVTVTELAVGIKRLFLQAIATPADTPDGPMRRVPPPIRRLVRAFVFAEAHRTTHEMRHRQAAIARVSRRR